MYLQPRQIVRLVIVIAAILLAPRYLQAASGCDGNGNCYIYASASGTGTGASWTNAYTGFGTGSGKVNPGSMARGVTYWIAAGAYGAQTFSSAASGTTVITLEGATTASHGPDATWSNTYAGQATFIGNTTVSSAYWVFNGQAEPGCSYPSNNSPSCYSMRFWNQTNTTGAAINISATNLTFEYLEVEGTGMTGGAFPNNTTADRCSSNECGSVTDNAFYTATSGNNTASNLYIGYCYVHHTGNTQFQLNTYYHNNATFEYNWVAYNHTGQNGQHDEAFSIYYSNLTVRFNVFQDICYAGIITTAGGGTPPLSNWDIYGNLIFWDPTYAALNGEYGLAAIDDGIVCFFGETMSGFVHYYNNTVAGLYNANMNAQGTGASTVAIVGVSGVSFGSPSVTVENNIWYGSGYSGSGFTPYCNVVSCASHVQDYDVFYQAGVPSGSFQTVSETHGQVVTAATNPFVSSSASTIAGYELTADTTAGVTLASPYNTDMLGVTRSANGTWDRGALQIGDPSSSQQPTPPADVAVISVQ
jgi:hypothetical protein